MLEAVVARAVREAVAAFDAAEPERGEALVERGQASGAFRADLDPAWLVRTHFALVHAADDHARAAGADRSRALEQLTATIRGAFGAGS